MPTAEFRRHGMEAALLTTSLLLIVAMLGSLGWLSSRREAVPVESADDSV